MNQHKRNCGTPCSLAKVCFKLFTLEYPQYSFDFEKSSAYDLEKYPKRFAKKFLFEWGVKHLGSIYGCWDIDENVICDVTGGVKGAVIPGKKMNSPQNSIGRVFRSLRTQKSQKHQKYPLLRPENYKEHAVRQCNGIYELFCFNVFHFRHNLSIFRNNSKKDFFCQFCPKDVQTNIDFA